MNSEDDDAAILQPVHAAAGAARRVLPSQTYSALFVAKPVSRLVTGEPARFLKRTDRRFVR